ncbi:ferredoxin [bacterium]|nr:ferredoxin [candidate division CSSED10-310 bacterium]
MAILGDDVLTAPIKHKMGIGGYCLCPKCDYRIPHQQGNPCQKMRCPECNAKLVREGSYHHKLIKMKKEKLKNL